MVGSIKESKACPSFGWLKNERGGKSMTEARYRVVIRCPECGEKYILRGRQKENGEYETGFKQCVCGNVQHLHIDAAPES